MDCPDCKTVRMDKDDSYDPPIYRCPVCKAEIEGDEIGIEKGKIMLEEKIKFEGNEKYIWLAGIIDSEGCLSVYINKSYAKCRRETSKYIIAVRIGNTSIKFLKQIKSFFNGSICHRKKSKYSLGEKPYYVLTFHAKQINFFIDKIIPYLIIKRKLAEFMSIMLKLKCREFQMTKNQEAEFVEIAKKFRNLNVTNKKNNLKYPNL